jgi:FixJ family two-component response regulator
MSTSIRVAIIDDDDSTRKALARLIKSAGIEAVTFASAGEFLDNPLLEQTDCVITDMRMPGLDGLELQEKLRQLLPGVSIVFLTGQGNVSTTVHAMKAGAFDFLEKPIDEDVLLTAIAGAVERSRKSKVYRAGIEDVKKRYSRLTPRERQVFALVNSGLLNKRVAADLGITERTTKVHRGRVMEKMKAGSLAELVRMAERLGLKKVPSPVNRCGQPRLLPNAESMRCEDEFQPTMRASR